MVVIFFCLYYLDLDFCLKPVWNTLLKNLEKSFKESVLVIIWLNFISISQMITIKIIFKSNFVFINT